MAADDALELLGHLTGGGGYKLTPPNAQAFQPNALEGVYAQLMGSKLSADNLVGGMVAANYDRQNAADQYSNLLRESNRYGYSLGIDKNATDRYKAQTAFRGQALAHPDQVAMIAPELVAPGMQTEAQRLSRAGIDLTEAKGFEARGKGAHDFVEAGLQMPMGATADTSGRLSTPMVQGTPLDERVANINQAGNITAARIKSAGDTAVANLARVTGYTSNMDNVVQETENNIASYERELLKLTAPVRDAQGNISQQAPMTVPEVQQRVAEYRQRAEQVANARRSQLNQGYRLGGFGQLQQGPAYSTPQAPPTRHDPEAVASPNIGAKSNDPNTPPNAPATATGQPIVRGAAAQNPGPASSPRTQQLSTFLRSQGVPDSDTRLAALEQRKAQLGGTGYNLYNGAVGIVKNGAEVERVPLR